MVNRRFDWRTVPQREAQARNRHRLDQRMRGSLGALKTTVDNRSQAAFDGQLDEIATYVADLVRKSQPQRDAVVEQLFDDVERLTKTPVSARSPGGSTGSPAAGTGVERPLDSDTPNPASERAGGLSGPRRGPDLGGRADDRRRGPTLIRQVEELTGEELSPGPLTDILRLIAEVVDRSTIPPLGLVGTPFMGGGKPPALPPSPSELPEAFAGGPEAWEERAAAWVEHLGAWAERPGAWAEGVQAGIARTERQTVGAFLKMLTAEGRVESSWGSPTLRGSSWISPQISWPRCSSATRPYAA